MHVELMQCIAREIVNDRIREAGIATGDRDLTCSQRESSSPTGIWRLRWAVTRRRSVGVAQR